MWFLQINQKTNQNSASVVNMKDYEMELNRLINDIVTLKNGRIYEIDNTPGNPTYNTLGNRMLDELNDLVHKIENNKN